MIVSVEDCTIAGAVSTNVPQVQLSIFVDPSTRLESGKGLDKVSCEQPVAPQDISPKSVSSFGDTISALDVIPDIKSHKRQRTDVMIGSSCTQKELLVCPQGCDTGSQLPQLSQYVDAEELCKPRAVYPINYKAPKVCNSPSSERSIDLEIPGEVGGWSQVRSSVGASLSDFTVGAYNAGSFHMNTVVDHRRLSRPRHRTNSYNHSEHYLQAPSEDGDQSQISIDLERISLAAPSSPFPSPRPALLPSPLLSVVFSPIQPVGFRQSNRSDMRMDEHSPIQDEEEQELVMNLPINFEANQSVNSHNHFYHLHPKIPENHNIFINNNPSFNNTHIPSIHTSSLSTTVAVVENSDFVDADVLIFNMDV